jgi:hypothetical protein
MSGEIRTRLREHQQSRRFSPKQLRSRWSVPAGELFLWMDFSREVDIEQGRIFLPAICMIRCTA